MKPPGDHAEDHDVISEGAERLTAGRTMGGHEDVPGTAVELRQVLGSIQYDYRAAHAADAATLRAVISVDCELGVGDEADRPRPEEVRWS